MKLYHFTSPFHIDGCLKEGITKGMLPLNVHGTISLLSGFQWLTSNDGYQQSWTEHSTLPYDRTAFRLTIKIPKLEHENLLYWLDFCSFIPFMPELNMRGDPENWYVFRGRIKPSWIREVNKKE